MPISVLTVSRAFVASAFAFALFTASPVAAQDNAAQDNGAQAAEWERLSQLGTAAFGANDLSLAELHFQAAFEIAEAIFEPEDPRFIATLVNLSQWQKGVGNPTEALVLLQRVLAIQESFLGPRHEDLMGTLALLAGLHAQLEQMDEAAAVYLRVLDLRRNRIGDYHPQTLATIAELAPVLEAVGDPQGAKQLYQEAILSWSELLGVHGRVAAAIDNYGEFLRRP